MTNHVGLRRRAWALVSVVAGLIAVFGLFVLASPVDPNDFSKETGIGWEDFSSAEPEVASYLEREARLLGAATIGLGLFSLAVALGGLRRGHRDAWRMSWILPGSLALISAIFFAGAGGTLGSVYLLTAGLTALAIAATPYETSRPAAGITSL